MTDTKLEERLRSIVDDIEGGGSPDHHRMVASVLCGVMADLNVSVGHCQIRMEANARLTQSLLDFIANREETHDSIH